MQNLVALPRYSTLKPAASTTKDALMKSFMSLNPQSVFIQNWLRPLMPFLDALNRLAAISHRTSVDEPTHELGRTRIAAQYTSIDRQFASVDRYITWSLASLIHREK